LEALSLLGRQTLTENYWSESLKITDADVEYLFSVMLEEEIPLDSLRMVRLFIERRVRQEDDTWRKRLGKGQVYQPKARYEAGTKLIFPALSFAMGEVLSLRNGSSPESGDFTVIEVEMDDGEHREFASDLQAPHKLNIDTGEDGEAPALEQLLVPVDVDALAARHGTVIRRKIEERLMRVDDVAYAAGLWFLKSLLPTIDQGHLNLAEAMLDMSGGGPMAAEDILPVLDLPAKINPTLQAFALNYGLYHDNRFDEVGQAGLVRWYLRRLEPEEVLHTPERITYEPIPYNRDLLTPEELALEAQIGDEHSLLPEPAQPSEQITLTLIYPHRRVGTLPLTAELSAMFPTAYEAERILITLVDGETGEEHAGWVVREGRYVCGLERYYRKYKLPIGAFVQIARTSEPGRFVVTFDGYRPRTEWITLVVPRNDRITFETQRRSIGAAYDDLMALGTDDLDGVDAIWRQARDRRRSLVEIIREILPEMARLNPQGAVHAKTIYSAVNVVRRCPPGPILAALESLPEFVPVGGHYWRFEKDA
jgi:hypothetical protein